MPKTSQLWKPVTVNGLLMYKTAPEAGVELRIIKVGKHWIMSLAVKTSVGWLIKQFEPGEDVDTRGGRAPWRHLIDTKKFLRAKWRNYAAVMRLVDGGV